MNCPHCSNELSHTRVYLVNGVVKCGQCRTPVNFSPDTQLRNWAKTVVIRNPTTGEYRIPGRADRPTHPKYLAAGFTERSTIDTGRDMVNFERSTGKVHEASNYQTSGSTVSKDTGAI